MAKRKRTSTQRPAKHYHDLPDWYHRLRKLHHNHRGKFEWKFFREFEFDQDLSEQAASAGEEVDSDGSSERSYNGVDANAYYDLKKLREGRKRVVREQAKEQKRKKLQRANKAKRRKLKKLQHASNVERQEMEKLQHGSKADERRNGTKRNGTKTPQEKVEAAYKLLKGKGPKPALSKPLASCTFDLFSKRSLKFAPGRRTRANTDKIRFTYEPNGFGAAYEMRFSPGDQLFARLYLNSKSDMDETYGPFTPPEHADPKPIELPDEDGMYPLYVTFVSDDYLKLSLSRYGAVDDDGDESEFEKLKASRGPKNFEFVGIRRDPEDESDSDDYEDDGEYDFW